MPKKPQSNHRRHLKHVTTRVKSAALRKRTAAELAFIANYMRSEHDFVGLTVPQQRALVKQGYEFFTLPDSEIAAVWNHIWHGTKIFEVRAQACIHIESWKKTPERLKAAWPHIKTWTENLENWAHSDSISGIIATLLEHDRALVLPTLKEWNRSTKPWQRRQSIVSLLYYASQREKVPPFGVMIKMVERLLEDPAFYVQRGVGWTLREMGHIYPKQTRAFVVKHGTTLSSIAFSSATEKWSTKEKAPLLRRRSREGIKAKILDRQS